MAQVVCTNWDKKSINYKVIMNNLCWMKPDYFKNIYNSKTTTLNRLEKM